MVYLVISIIATIVLVAVVIRRLPYLRTHRPGLEISMPRPYVRSQTWWRGLVARGLTILASVRGRLRTPKRSVNVDAYQSDSALTTANQSSQIGQTALPGGTYADEVAPDAEPAHPFWSEESNPGVVELPEKGLVTRRGEAQKIAHELTAQADAAFRKENYKDAEKYYLQAVAKDPDNARIYNRLGVIYLRTKNYKDAVEAFRGSIKFDDRVASRHYNLALAYLGKKDYRSAQKAIEEAIRLEPTNDKYRQTLEALSQ